MAEINWPIGPSILFYRMTESLYWSLLALAIGGCVGSYLNVIVYRWPRGLSTTSPLRSFCPTCQHAIAWYDNIPVLSYLILRGRCRHCQSAISLQYPLIELATALAFLMVFDAFFVAHLRAGVTGLPTDLAMLIGQWVLYAGLIGLAVMDLESYTVDIRITWIIALVGLIAHTLWTPAGSISPSAQISADALGPQGWLRPGTTLAGIAFAAAAGLLISAMVARPAGDLQPEEEMNPAPLPSQGESKTTETSSLSMTAARNWWWLCMLPLVALVVFYMVWMLTSVSTTSDMTRYYLPGLLPVSHSSTLHLDANGLRLILGFLGIFFGLTLVASQPRPEVDSEIIEAIHAEAPAARPVAFKEFLWLSPSIVLGCAAIIFLNMPAGTGAGSMIHRILHWQPIDRWQPFWGLSTALAGWIIGGAIGWLARIFFTFAFGKEALGMGDVHILAAAGAMAGWPVVLLGFFLSSFLALLALMVIALRRQARTLPYGPWLALAFLLAGFFQDYVLEMFHIRQFFE